MPPLKRALELIRTHAIELSDAGIENPIREAELLLYGAGSLDQNTILRDNPLVSEKVETTFRTFIKRRISGEPLQYILGTVEFCNLSIQVGPGILIPRPETEFLVHEAVEIIKTTYDSPIYILDLGTGSGCIAAAMAKQFPKATVYGIDSSVAALAYARKNSLFNQACCNTHFIAGSFFDPLCGVKFHMIVSNPPYIRAGEIDALQREIKDWEPRQALDGGEDGLACYRQILAKAPAYLLPGAYMVLEVGMGQDEEVANIAEQHGLICTKVIADYAGIKRVVILKQGI
ncbi:MAG TPA: peptide chain release factor N(5)-glutamine methyltransferase [Thermodesulfovibrionia bacterium]|nr:peptide chain release factor N(5)-glutamine methyltransferase [Thermodesulfovibrionia bacterium]